MMYNMFLIWRNEMCHETFLVKVEIKKPLSKEEKEQIRKRISSLLNSIPNHFEFSDKVDSILVEYKVT